MRLKLYAKCKDSGIDWIREIPENWKVYKLKYLLKIPITDGPHETPEFIDEGIPFLSVDSIQNGKLIFENCRYISEEDHVRFKKKCNPMEGDIFLGKAASIGKIAMVNVNFEFSIWSPLALLRPNNKIMQSKFLEYVLKSDYSQIQIDILATSNTQKNISMDDIPRIKVIVSPLDEQISIVKFLDKKTSEIDALIEKDKKLIALLKEKRIALINHAVTKGLDPNAKMKDSGIKWIGEIPEDWEVKKLKFNIKENKIKDNVKNPNTKFIGLEHIESETGKLISSSTLEEIDGESIRFEKNNVLFGKLRPYLSKVIKMDFRGSCTAELIVYETGKKIDSKYLFYRLISKSFIDSVNSMTYGVKMPRADSKRINNIKVAWPSLIKQKIIADYLDNATFKIEYTIQKIEEKIKLLEEYKKSLIHHVVTGKIDVREAI
jgi:restriction endonuclease S subunit